MSTIAWRAWEILGGLAAPKFVTREIAVLLILAASLLVFRTLRERCLMVWIVGWLAYLVSRSTSAQHPHPLPEGIAALVHAELVLAACLFAAAIFIYTQARRLLVPLCLIALVLIPYAVLQGLLWRESVVANAVLEVAFHLILIFAAARLIWFRWARWEIGPWLLSLCLLSLRVARPRVGAARRPRRGSAKQSRGERVRPQPLTPPIVRPPLILRRNA